jgi:MurNAc alpha-1-phosphate uridylyltransferase
MTTPDAAFIPAAGFGTRMRPLTDDCPKPLLPLGGTPMLDRAIALARAAGISKIAVNAHYLADRIVAHLSETDVRVSVEAAEILDTGGGLKSALPLLDTKGPILTLNPDVLYVGPNPVAVLADTWASAKVDALLLVVDLCDALGRHAGDFATDAAGRITRRGDAVFTGAQIIQPDVIDAWPGRIFGMNAVWDDLIARDRIRAVRYPGRWCDLGTPEALRQGEALLAGGVP